LVPLLIIFSPFCGAAPHTPNPALLGYAQIPIENASFLGLYAPHPLFILGAAPHTPNPALLGYAQIPIENSSFLGLRAPNPLFILGATRPKPAVGVAHHPGCPLGHPRPGTLSLDPE